MNVGTQPRHRRLLLHAVFWHGNLVKFGLQSPCCVLEALAQASGRASYDHVSASQDIVSADLDNQVAVAKALFQTYLTDATNIWNNPLAIAQQCGGQGESSRPQGLCDEYWEIHRIR